MSHSRSQKTAEKPLVRKGGPYTSEDIHKALFPDGPPARRTLAELKKGIEDYIREKHARR